MQAKWTGKKPSDYWVPYPKSIQTIEELIHYDTMRAFAQYFRQQQDKLYEWIDQLSRQTGIDKSQLVKRLKIRTKKEMDTGDGAMLTNVQYYIDWDDLV